MRTYYSPEEIRKLNLQEKIALTKKELVPIYSEENISCVESLNYSCSSWLRDSAVFPEITAKAINDCRPKWFEDGFNLTNWDLNSGALQFCFAVKAEIPPVKFMQKVKGRLDHALRKLGHAVIFSRKIAFRCLGENTREIVNGYVKKQVRKSDFADERYKKFLGNYTIFESKTNLKEPFTKYSGKYWYNIHLVIVAADRSLPITQSENFEKLKIYIPKIATKKECKIAHFAIMPDHIHISLRGNPELSPREIGLSFLNNLAYILGNFQCWNSEFYVGTFSEYSVDKLL